MRNLAQIADVLENLAEAVGLPREQAKAALAEGTLAEVKNLINPHPPTFKTMQELHDHLIVSMAEFSQLFGQVERQLGAINSFTGNTFERAQKSKDPALYEKIRKLADGYFRGASANLKITASGIDNFANVLLPHYWKNADDLLKHEAHRWSQTQLSPAQKPSAPSNRETQPSGHAVGRTAADPRSRIAGDRDTKPSMQALRGVS